MIPGIDRVPCNGYFLFMENNSDWPPPHRFRRSGKARHINLRLIPGQGLEIVLPERPVYVSEQMGLLALERHKGWVLRQLEKMAGRRVADAVCHTDGACLPSSFFLHGGVVPVLLEWAHHSLQMPLPNPGAVFGGNGDGVPPIACRLKDGAEADKRTRLRLWLRLYAEHYLGLRLAALAHRHGLSFKKMSVGWQKSRWGSYSLRGSIRLNAKLVFLPVELSDIVMLHELCHSLEMNHGKYFWRELTSREPKAREMERGLSKAGCWIPLWAG